MTKKIASVLINTITILSFLSCSNSEKENIVDKKESYTYKMTLCNDKLITLDETTVQTSPYMQVLNRADTILFAFINEYDNSIIINNFNTGELFKKIRFDKEGSDGVGSLSSFFISDSTIYLYQHWSEILYTTNLSGKVNSSKKIDQTKFISENYPTPVILPRTLSPLYKLGDNIILTGFSPTEKEDETDSNRPSTVIYNIKKDKITLCNSFPSIYHKGHWGAGINHRGIRYAISSNDEMVISYSVDKYIYVIDSTETKKKYYAGGIGHKKAVGPMFESRRKVPYNEKVMIEHYMENISYGGILYDQYNNLYYRICLNPTNNYSINDPIQRKPVSIIILDANFNKIGESAIPELSYDIMSCVISPEGLHIQIESDNDDIMIFKTFKPEKI